MIISQCVMSEINTLEKHKQDSLLVNFNKMFGRINVFLERLLAIVLSAKRRFSGITN